MNGLNKKKIKTIDIKIKWGLGGGVVRADQGYLRLSFTWSQSPVQLEEPFTYLFGVVCRQPV